ncbi:solute carrier family 22 member 6 isoform X2 [Amia ocellicauda]|uniref:solute carrier family 22 member 6 isoform X2 n=1 Tax=Amia ocellicauda TaxID=2972642 RepID=UPI003464E0C6
MCPLQTGVYCRLSLIFVLSASMFFIDVFVVKWVCTDQTGNDTFSHETPGKNVSHQTSDANRTVWKTLEENSNRSACLESKLLSYGQIMYMTGLLVGSLFAGALADRYGKKIILVGTCVVQALTALMSAFTTNGIFHLAARLICGITCCGINISSFSLGVEWSLPKYRMWPPALLSFSFSIGMMGLAAIAFLTSDWQQFHLAIAVPQILCLPICFFIPESPRWLMMNGRFRTLEKYRSRSKEDKESLDLILGTMEGEMQHSVAQRCETEKQSDLQHFKSQTIILRLCVMSYISLASALTYFGICFNVGNFGVNIYLAQFFSGLSEAPTLAVPFLLTWCGRRSFSMAFLLMSGSACLLSLLVSKFCDMPALVLTLALMGKLCMQTTVFVSVLYGIELFPTVISGPIVGSGLCLLLPETSGIPLPDTVKDCERQSRFSFFWERQPEKYTDKEVPFLKNDKPPEQDQEATEEEKASFMMSDL